MWLSSTVSERVLALVPAGMAIGTYGYAVHLWSIHGGRLAVAGMVIAGLALLWYAAKGMDVAWSMPGLYWRKTATRSCMTPLVCVRAMTSLLALACLAGSAHLNPGLGCLAFTLVLWLWPVTARGFQDQADEADEADDQAEGK